MNGIKGNRNFDWGFALQIDDGEGDDDDGTAVISEWQMRHPLIMQGVVVVPQRIDHDAYLHVMDGLTKARILNGGHYPITLLISGIGGDADYAFAIGDFINKFGNVIAIAIGCAYSAHALIWSLCPYRSISKNGSVALHQIASKIMPSAIVDIVSEADNLLAVQKRIEQTLASISNKDEMWWHETLKHRINSCLYLDVAQATALGMISEFPEKTEEVVQ